MMDASGVRTDPLEFCTEILPHVSRTFALTIPTLQEPLRTQVGVSYLLCRVVDTIEDHESLSPDLREDLFLRFETCVMTPVRVKEFLDLWPGHPDLHHDTLVSRVGLVLDAFETLPPPAREAIRHCIRDMTSGMQSFPAPTGGSDVLQACANMDRLEQYCHFVAGTVGILLSSLFAAEIDPEWKTPARIEQGRRLGLGLQLTNIIKDHAADRARGISFIPLNWFEDGTLTRRGREIIVNRALEHLDAGQEYIVSLPEDREDMRLFCLWASHLALATLRLAASGEPRPAKVDREELWAIVEKARRLVRSNQSLTVLHGNYRQATLDALA